MQSADLRKLHHLSELRRLYITRDRGIHVERQVSACPLVVFEIQLQKEPLPMPRKNQPESVGLSATLTIPELEQSKAAVLNTLASQHSRRSYEYAIERFIAWYCSEPRLTFNRSVVVKYRAFLERLSLSAATINLHLSAIRRLADESAESGWLSTEHAIGIRRVKGVKRLGRKMGNWLTRNQAQELVNAVSKTNLCGWRDGAMLGLLLGCAG
jgi:hypothetical protein